MEINNFRKSRELQQRVHQLIPGGAHTYAKGDDQFPWLAPGFIERGLGCYVWDVDGNRYIEYGMGCRAVTLGHAFSPIVEAVREAIGDGCNFSRPALLELQCAEELVSMIDSAEMCKFSKNGSDATTAALKLARAVTGRQKVAFCHDQPFFSIDDWFIGTTAIDGGIPQSVKDLSVGFPYNDLDALKDLFKQKQKSNRLSYYGSGQVSRAGIRVPAGCSRTVPGQWHPVRYGRDDHRISLAQRGSTENLRP